MDTKLDWEVDVEGIVDMVDRGEEGASMNRRPCMRPNTAHSTSLDATPSEFPGPELPVRREDFTINSCS